MENPPAADILKSAPTEVTGLHLIADNHDALAVRILSARECVSTLDLMYYLWRDDRCGRLLLAEVLAAADRGVRVRILIDDINPQSSDATYLGINNHPNIELRLFNPSIARNGSFLRKVELVWRVVSMTRRMHAKAWIADRKVAVVGGRNIGDEYFDAAETNFRDLDLLMFGAGVVTTCSIFDAYWNHEAAKSVRLLNPGVQQRQARADSEKIAGEIQNVLKGRLSLRDFLAEDRRVHWVENVGVLADPPEKVFGQNRENWLLGKILPVLRSAARRLDIVSPYFIPGRAGTRVLGELVAQGADVSVVTNSLAATDVAAVHGAYANYRVPLLQAGIKLFEFRSILNKANLTVFGSKGASLHTKAFVVDDRTGFIGSFNFDPRSSSLNAEMGILFEDEALAGELNAYVQADKTPSTSFGVSLTGNGLCWDCVEDGEVRTFSTEPDASWRRRLIAAIVKWLPIESQL